MIEPWRVPQSFYDMIMELPNGADVTEFFECDDPDWHVTSITLYKTTGNRAVLSCNSILAMEPTAEEKQ